MSNPTKTSHHNENVQSQRTMLRRVLRDNPHDLQSRQELKQLLQPAYIRLAAQQGVFICYSRDDELFALDLDDALHEAGIRAWMDEVDIPEELDWDKAVGNALRNCGVLLLILSPDALEDAEIQEERRYFLDAGKVVIPVLHQPCYSDKLGMMIPPIDMHNDFQEGLQHLMRLLGQSSDVTTS